MAEKSALSRFLNLFPDRHQTFVRSRNSIYWRNTSQWHYLTDEEIVSSISASSSILRAFGQQEKTNFIVIQIEGSSNPAPAQTMKNLLKQLTQDGIKAKPYYLADLDIWQIFIYLCESIDSQIGAAAIENWLSTSWFAVDRNSVSILPNGNPLPIPLQAGFTWIDENLNTVISAAQMPLQDAAALFLQDLRENANAPSLLTELQQKEEQAAQSTYADLSTCAKEPFFELEDFPAANNALCALTAAGELIEINSLISDEEINHLTLSDTETNAFEPAAYAGPEYSNTPSPDGNAGSEDEQKQETALPKQILECSSDQLPWQHTESSIELATLDNAVDNSAYPDHAIYSGRSVESPEAIKKQANLEPARKTSSQRSADLLSNREPTASLDSQTPQAAYATPLAGADSIVSSINKDPPAGPSMELRKKESPKNSQTRDGPSPQKKSKTIKNTQMDSYEQLMLPF